LDLGDNFPGRLLILEVRATGQDTCAFHLFVRSGSGGPPLIFVM
jgi:hypothetical protein